MFCALLSKEYVPSWFDTSVKQYHGLSIYTVFDVPLIDGQWRQCVISTGLSRLHRTFPSFYEEPEDAVSQDQAHLSAFKCHLQYLLENIFTGQVSASLNFQRLPGKLEDSPVYRVYYGDYDLYVHPDCLEILEEQLLKPAQEVTLGPCFIKTSMLEGDKFYINEMLHKFVNEFSNIFVIKETPKNLHVFFQGRGPITNEILDGYLKYFENFTTSLRESGWLPLSTPVDYVRTLDVTATPDGYYAEDTVSEVELSFELTPLEFKAVTEFLKHLKSNILTLLQVTKQGDMILVTGTFSNSSERKLAVQILSNADLLRSAAATYSLDNVNLLRLNNQNQKEKRNE